MKKVLCLSGSVMIFIFFIGCRGAIVSNKDTLYLHSGVSNDSSAQENLNPVTFTMLLGETNPYADNFESPVAKKITELTGVTLDIEYLVSGDEKSKLSLMAASGNYPDLVFAKGNVRILKDVGALVKLDDMIKNSAYIKNFYGDQIIRLQYSKEDKSIYVVGGKKFGEKNMEPNAGFQLQHAVVKELGYPEMQTLQDFEYAIKAYKERYPMINGKETIGLSLLADDWRFMISVSNPACFATGGPDDGEWYVDQETLKATRHLLRPEEKEYFRWLNHMNDIGLLDPESFVQKYYQYIEKIASGRVLALADARWEIQEPIAALEKAGKLDRTYGYYPITLSEDIKNAEFMPTGYLGGWGISITTGCKDIERAFEFLDWMHSEKAQILTHWGIEGLHYDIIGGNRVMKSEIKAMKNSEPAFPSITGMINYDYPFPSYGNMIKDSTGQCYEPFTTLESIMDRQNPVENEVLSSYGVEAWKDLYPHESEFSPKPYGAAWLISIDDADWQAKNQDILDAGYKMIPAAILSSPDEFDEKWEEYIQEVKELGIDEMTEIFEMAIKDKVEMWNMN